VVWLANVVFPHLLLFSGAPRTIFGYAEPHDL
jgi:hypothetical protein